MPILNDEELIDILKKNEEWKNIPVIMISGAFPKKMLKHYLAIGVNQIMKRPLSKNYKSAFEKVIDTAFNKNISLLIS